MRKPIALLIAGLILHPNMAEAAACKLDHGTFRPNNASQSFVLRRSRDSNSLSFDLAIQRSGETFRFWLDVDDHSGEGMIASVPDSSGLDAGIKATFALVDVKGLTSTPHGEVGYIAFQDLGRAFVEFRLRQGQQPDATTSPPSGLWHVSECQAN
jgi:hypothetical protein